MRDSRVQVKRVQSRRLAGVSWAGFPVLRGQLPLVVRYVKVSSVLPWAQKVREDPEGRDAGREGKVSAAGLRR